MYCWNCGQEIDNDIEACPNCGAKSKNYYETNNQRLEKQNKKNQEKINEYKNEKRVVERNNFGIASLILSIFSFFVSLYFIVPVTSFILGFIGVANMDKYTELNKLAAVGFVFSIVSIVMWIVLIIEDVLSSPMWMFF